MNYYIIDTNNLFFRARYATRGDSFTKAGLSLHIAFSSLRQMWNKFGEGHVIFCTEGKSWRYDEYPQYKANRKDKKDNIDGSISKSSEEIEEDEYFFSVITDFVEFLTTKTNCTVLHHPRAEADDLIARYIHNLGYITKDSANFTIISTDTDFYQLLRPNVHIYDGVNKHLHKIDGIYDERDKPVKNKQGEILKPKDPEWALFYKCMRGDKTDNIFSAYPGLREKGSSKKPGMLDAFEDRHKKGWAWNNIMMEEWEDHRGNKKVVKDCYEFNKKLIDLSLIREDVRDEIDYLIIDSLSYPKNVQNIAFNFLKFCKKYELETLAKYPDSIIEILKKTI